MYICGNFFKVKVLVISRPKYIALILCFLLIGCIDYRDELSRVYSEESSSISYPTVSHEYEGFEYINTGVDLSTSKGEAFLGLTKVGDWLIQVPQDHHSIVFYNTVKGNVKELNVSKYKRAVLKKGASHRDKFNGAVVSHNGKFLWICPSWATHLLKIDMESFKIIKDFELNTAHDDSYNEMILTQKYLWLVTHSKEDLPRIDLETDEIKVFALKEPVLGGYSFGKGAANRSFYGGADNLDGHIFLYPRRSKYLIKIHEETGKVVAQYKHPLSDIKDYGAGYFHGGIKVGSKIYFSPWSSKKVIIFNTLTEEYKSLEVELSGYEQFTLASAYDGRKYVWMAPFKCKELIKVDVKTDKVVTVDAQNMINAYQDGSTRKNTDPNIGFGGGAILKDNSIWFSSVYESSFIKMPLNN